MILPIHLYGTRVWDGPPKKVTRFDDNLVGLIRDMFETMRNADGIGLAANQVGLQLALAVMDISEMEDYKNEKPLIVINPEIVESKGECAMEEGCLSIPGIRDEVKRAESVRVRFTNGNSERVETELSGMWARVFQHEYDHLQQKFFINRLSNVKRQILKPKLSKIKKGNMQAKYPVFSTVDERKKR
ncbi:MAG TPA: peptide deformylase [Candidatus Acidoferrales bacterium]|nr:peptide deformylase [Candidatus Acidoferrales bacterium]